MKFQNISQRPRSIMKCLKILQERKIFPKMSQTALEYRKYRSFEKCSKTLIKCLQNTTECNLSLVESCEKYLSKIRNLGFGNFKEIL